MTEREAQMEREALDRLVGAALAYCHWVRATPLPDVGPERDLRLAAIAYCRATAWRVREELDRLFAESEAGQDGNPDPSAARTEE